MLLIALLAMAAPAGAAVTISPTGGDDTALIAGAISDAALDDNIVILSKGTYLAHDIVVPADVTIRADTANGQGPSDTKIDAQSLGRIFDDSGNYALTIDNLTLQNGAASLSSHVGQGGAIRTDSGIVTVTSSTISGCKADYGGAIYTYSGSVTVTSSTISGCLAEHRGGAIYTYSGSVTVTSSTISGCRADGSEKRWDGVAGGAIYTDRGSVTVTSTTISECQTKSPFETYGGAIFSISGSVTVTSSTISGCQADYGGAIYTDSGSVTVTSSTISRCKADYGGAIITDIGSVKVTSSTISEYQADNGGAILMWSGSGTVQFCRLIGNSASGSRHTLYGDIDAAYNWWGNNTGPSPDDLRAGASADRWLVLGITASPSSITYGSTSSVTANLTYDSKGVYHDPTAGHLPDTVPVSFELADGTGSFLPPRGNTTSGSNTTTYDPFGTSSVATVRARVDDETADARILITILPPVLTGIAPSSGTTAGGDRVTVTGTGFMPGAAITFGGSPGSAVSVVNSHTITVTTPAHAAGAVDVVVTNPDTQSGTLANGFTYFVVPTTGSSGNSGGDTGSSDTDSSETGRNNPATGHSQLAPLEEEPVNVNVGGATQIFSVVVSGSGNRDMIVTATELSGSEIGVPPLADLIVYKYFMITPAQYSDITGADFTFTVPQAWLDEHHVLAENIAMYRYNEGKWTALLTTVIRTANGQVYFSAESPGFSLFAIAGKAGSAAATTSGSVRTIGDIAGVTAAAQPAATSAPARLAPTMLQPAESSAPVPVWYGSGFPLTTFALIGAGCLGLVGSGWYIRRWWIRRQNPVLFEKYN